MYGFHHKIIGFDSLGTPSPPGGVPQRLSPRGQSLRQGPRGVQSEWLATPFSEIVLTRTISEDSFAKYPVSDPSQRLSYPPGGGLSSVPDWFPQRSWYQDLGTKILVPRSWYQDIGTKILVPRSTILVPRSWYLPFLGKR